jgi:hypothetical protein
MVAELVTKMVEYAPAVSVLVWLVVRTDARAEECMHAIMELLKEVRDKPEQ